MGNLCKPLLKEQKLPNTTITGHVPIMEKHFYEKFYDYILREIIEKLSADVFRYDKTVVFFCDFSFPSLSRPIFYFGDVQCVLYSFKPNSFQRTQKMLKSILVFCRENYSKE